MIDSTLAAYMFSVFLGMLLLWLFFKSTQVVICAIKSNSWPASEGFINSVRIDEETDQDGTNYKAEISYKYSVSGIEYTSTNIAFLGIMSLSLLTAEYQGKKFSAGSSAKVYFNPNRHNEAVLIPGITRLQMPSIIYLLCFSLFITLITINITKLSN